MNESSTAPKRKERDDVTSVNSTHRLSKSAVSLVPGPKPLKAHKFYLDVKSRFTSNKLEAKIKELGGVLELFLVREVTHVVTDREEWLSGTRGVGSLPRTPRTPQQLQQDESPAGDQQRSTPVRGRPKTRADAMLERARSTTAYSAAGTHHQQPALTDHPLEQAKHWQIPVWSIDKALIWLEKVANNAHARKQKRRVIELKSPYLKFEAYDRRHRPVFKEIRNWPCFDLRTVPGSTGLVYKPAGAQIMTKSRAPPQRKKVCALVRQSAPAGGGYCELCREEFQNLEEHTVSKKHVAFVRDNDNFLELDTLIRNGTDLDTFLQVNETNRNGLVDSQTDFTFVPHKMPRTRTSSINDCNINKVKHAPISPTVSETGHRLRTRRANMTYIGLTAHEQEEGATQIKPEGARETRELRSSIRNQLKCIEPESPVTWNSGRPKRACIRRKRRSFFEETGLNTEQRGYYKVEMTPKLRSSATYKEVAVLNSPARRSPIREVPEPPSDQFDSKALIVKFKRLRSSELRQLSNEAENFLFPKKDDSSSEEDVDADCRDTTVSTHPGDSIVISSETETENDDEKPLINHDLSSDLPENRRRKRLTQAEAFIQDNKKYYKFEMPGTRLRYHGTTLNNLQLSPRKHRFNGETCGGANNEELELPAAVQSDCDSSCTKRENCKFTLDELQFSFETIPKSEPWYETFSRQDQGEEYYTCFSDSGYWKPFLLPYQMNRIQPLDPKVCIQTYTQIKKLLTTESSGTNSTATDGSTPDCSAHGSPVTIDADDNSKASEDSTLITMNAMHTKVQSNTNVKKVRKVRRKNALVTSKNPRKSPRQHASTLAILSSLIPLRRKRRTTSPNNTLESIPESNETESNGGAENVRAEEIHKVAESIDDMLTNAFGDMEQVEIMQQDEDEVLEFSCKSDAIEILEDYENCKIVDRKSGLIGGARRCYSVGRRHNKKRKNRTGWPGPRTAVKRNLHSVLGKAHNLCNNSSMLDESIDKKTQTDLDTSDDTLCASVNNKPISVCEDDRVALHDGDEESDSNVGGVEWENADKVLLAKIANDANKEQLTVAAAAHEDEKTGTGDVKSYNRRLRSSSSPPPVRSRSNGAKRARRLRPTSSPKSPRVLRKSRGRWYRER